MLWLILADFMQQTGYREYFHIGRIVAAHGLRGEVKVLLMSSDPDRFMYVEQCFLTDESENSHQLVEVLAARKQAGSWLVQLKGINDRTAAEALRGSFISVNRELALPLEENEYFIADLIGCLVYDEKHGLLGQVADILNHQAHDLYIIRKKGEKDLLMPAVKSIIRAINPVDGRIDVSLPEGLYEIYR